MRADSPDEEVEVTIFYWVSLAGRGVTDYAGGDVTVLLDPF